MKKRKLNYRFHNPNTVEDAADYILKIMIEANQEKVRQAVHTAASHIEPITTSEQRPA